MSLDSSSDNNYCVNESVTVQKVISSKSCVKPVDAEASIPSRQVICIGNDGCAIYRFWLFHTDLHEDK